MDDREKLRHLISHWQEHNREHARTYREWAGKMEGVGMHEASRLLREVIASTEKTTEIFDQIRKLL